MLKSPNPALGGHLSCLEIEGQGPATTTRGRPRCGCSIREFSVAEGGGSALHNVIAKTAMAMLLNGDTLPNCKADCNPLPATLRIFLLIMAFWWATPCSAALQFDVFLGYDGVVPEACWFPVACEARNDGPTFTGTVEIRRSGFGPSETEKTVIELPTGTLKRFVIPVFSDARSSTSFDVRLRDQNGKLRSEQLGLRARRNAMAGTPVLGSLSRSPGGTPEIAPIRPQQSDLQPASARLLPAVFPDNALMLEGLDCLYLNSERAADLNPAQAKAISAWVEMGGHLIVAVEQPGDVSASPWLKRIFPLEPRELRTVDLGSELEDWVRRSDWPSKPTFASRSGAAPYNAGGRKSASTSRPPAATLDGLLDESPFKPAPAQVSVGDLKRGKVEVAVRGIPLMVSAPRGNGLVTALLFSPEREPFRSWKHLPLFWAKLAGVPREWYETADFVSHGGYTSDSILGAMIDSRQVHKLPLEWLLALLIAYLVVIGPFDYFFLKRLRRPMLTWITFPIYVLAFSGLIYLIGYKLRAGESELNELHVVDLLLDGERADFRGRSYASVYSPANATYIVDGTQKRATFRGEFASSWGSGQGVERVTVFQVGDSFRSEVNVPVWTPQLFVSDWLEGGPSPVLVKVAPDSSGWKVEVENRMAQKLNAAHIVIGERLISLGEIGAHKSETFNLARDEGPRLKDFVSQRLSAFQMAVQSRGHAFGRAHNSRVDDLTNSLVAISFLSQASPPDGGYMGGYVAPPGFDLTPAARRSNAVFMAWIDNYSPSKQMFNYSPRRSHRSTFWRCTVPLTISLP